MANEYEIKIFTNTLRNNTKPTFKFSVDTEEQMISHVKQLFRDGYRRVAEQGAVDTVQWFPPHIIEKVEVTGPNLSKGYIDTDITT